MERTRMELLPGVWLTAVRDRERPHSCLRAALLAQLDRETAGLNALLPDVLLCGSAQHPGPEQVRAAFQALGGAVQPLVRKYGEIQAVGLSATADNDPSRLETFAQTFANLLLTPDTSFGQMQKTSVEHALALREEREETDPFAELIGHLCGFEDFALSPWGEDPEAGPNFYQKLTKHYRAWLSASPVELYYCGAAPAKEVARVLTDAFMAIPRGELDEELGTDVRMNAIDAEPRVLDASDESGAHWFSAGWRLGDAMEDPDPAVLEAVAAVIRYLARQLEPEVRLDLHKGLLMLRCETDPGETELQLDLMKNFTDIVRTGGFSPAALDMGKQARIRDLLDLPANDAALEDFWLSQTLLGLDWAPDEFAAFLEEVSPAETVQAAAGLELDAVLIN